MRLFSIIIPFFFCRLTLHLGISEHGSADVVLPYFPVTHLVCVVTQWDLPKAVQLSHRPEAATHPGKQVNMEEQTH